MLKSFIQHIEALEPGLANHDAMLMIKNNANVLEYSNETSNEFLREYTGVNASNFCGLNSEELFTHDDWLVIQEYDEQVKSSGQGNTKIQTFNSPIAAQEITYIFKQPIIADGKIHGILGKLTSLNTFKVLGQTVTVTKREYQIMMFWLFGYTWKEIGRYCHCSPRTVESCIDRLKQKLNITSKNQLMTHITPAQVEAYLKIIQQKLS